MQIFADRPVLRWAVPAGAAAAVAAIVAGSGVLAASADSGLAPLSARQLLAQVQTARVDGFSGTVVQRSELGLPSLPGVRGSGSSELTSLISGTHTMRVWYSGPDKARLALMGNLGESDVIRNGRDVWVWSSEKKTAGHFVAPAKKSAERPPSTDLGMTPQEAADRALQAINPSTEVTTSGTAQVAGRSAYELTLKPRDATSLVESVRIAIDGEKRVPLRVQVFSKSANEPAFEVAFSSVEFAKPEAAQFVFNPPPGTTVSEVSAESLMSIATTLKAKGEAAAEKPMAKPQVVGQGWGAVVVTTIPPQWLSSAAAAEPQSGRDARRNGPDMGQVLRSLPQVSGEWGSGRLLKSRLLTVVLADDGRVAIGAVTPQAAYAALAK